MDLLFPSLFAWGRGGPSSGERVILKASAMDGANGPPTLDWVPDPPEPADRVKAAVTTAKAEPQPVTPPWRPNPPEHVKRDMYSGKVIQQRLANVGSRESLNTLRDEFAFSEKFQTKVDNLLGDGYFAWRRVRGDGNCFFRAVGFGFLECLVNCTAEQRSRWMACFMDNLRSLHGGFEKPEYEAINTDLIRHMEHLLETGAWEAPRDYDGEVTAMGILFRSMVQTEFRERKSESESRETLDLAMIRAMRMLAARYMTQHRNECVFMEGITVEELCCAQGFSSLQTYLDYAVLEMGTEAEGVLLSAIPPILGAHCRVAFLDRTNCSEVSYCDYWVGSKRPDPDDDTPLVHVQLRPGHYDLIYHTQPSTTSPQPKLYRQQTFGEFDGIEYRLGKDPNDPEEVRKRWLADCRREEREACKAKMDKAAKDAANARKPLKGFCF